MSVIQLSPQLHQVVNLFKKLGIQANMNVSNLELELVKKNFRNTSNNEGIKTPEARDWWSD